MRSFRKAFYIKAWIIKNFICSTNIKIRRTVKVILTLAVRMTLTVPTDNAYFAIWGNNICKTIDPSCEKYCNTKRYESFISITQTKVGFLHILSEVIGKFLKYKLRRLKKIRKKQHRHQFFDVMLGSFIVIAFVLSKILTIFWKSFKFLFKKQNYTPLSSFVLESVNYKPLFQNNQQEPNELAF